MNTGWKVNRHLEGFTGDPYDQLWENLVELEKNQEDHPEGPVHFTG